MIPVSYVIAKNNTNFRAMMQELGTKGTAGFVDREIVINFKRVSQLNTKPTNFLGKIGGKTPVIKLPWRERTCGWESSEVDVCTLIV